MSGVFADGQGHLLNEGQATTLEGLDVSALSELNFIQGQTYTLVETAAPAGYVLAEGSFTFVVASDGTLVAGEGPKAYEPLSDGQVGVRVSDDPAPGVVPGVSGAAPLYR